MLNKTITSVVLYALIWLYRVAGVSCVGNNGTEHAK